MCKLLKFIYKYIYNSAIHFENESFYFVDMLVPDINLRDIVQGTALYWAISFNFMPCHDCQTVISKMFHRLH